jgi:hypothetical protein
MFGSLPPSATALTDEDHALVEAARSTIDAVTDAGPANSAMTFRCPTIVAA